MLPFRIYNTNKCEDVIVNDVCKNYEQTLIENPSNVVIRSVMSIGNIGLYSCVVYINGSGDLIFIKSDSTGKLWGNPIVLDNILVNDNININIINLPDNTIAVFYINSNYLYYVKSDNTGNNWDIPVNTNIQMEIGSYISSLLINGKPSIFYIDTQNLYLSKSTDLFCSSFTERIKINQTGTVDTYNEFKSFIINGNPSIVYCDFSNNTLQYIRSDDIYGTNWIKKINLNLSLRLSFARCSLNVINGKPIIAYSPLKNGNNVSVLSVIISKDINGNSWNEPIVIDTGNLLYYGENEGIKSLYINVILNKCYITYFYRIENVITIRMVLQNNSNLLKWNIPQIIFSNSIIPNVSASVLNNESIVLVSDSTFDVSALYYLNFN